MDGLGRTLGAGVPIEFEGETLILDPLTLEDFGVIEQHLLSKRKNPLDVVRPILQDLPPDMAEKLLEKAYQDARRENTIAPDEVAEWIDSIDGLAFCVWLCLERRYKGKYTLKQALRVLQAMTEQQLVGLKDARDQASGLDEQGNSTGQAQKAAEEKSHEASAS